MLSELRIENLALVEMLHLEFGAGLTALTGETGAGKSLVIGALDLVLGARAASGLVRRGADRAMVTARFEDLDPALFPEAEEGAIVLRRAVGSDGRSRAWVDDRPVSVGNLRALGTRLADLHGQHEQQNVLRRETHLEAVDAFGVEASLRDVYADAWLRTRETREARDAFAEAVRRDAAEREFLHQQYRELEDAELRAGEEEDLEREHRVSAHSERLRELVGEATEDLTDEDGGAAARLGHAERRLREAARHDPALEPLIRDLEAARLTAEETGREVAQYLDSLESDPRRLESLEARLAVLARLRRKYARDEAGLVALREELRARVGEGADPAARLEDLEAEVRQAEEALEDAASALSDARSKAAARLGREVTRELRGLGMADARFTVRLEAPAQGLTLPGRTAPVTARGAETAVFLLAANPGEPGGPVDEVASGGEASRVMLALKTVLHRTDPVGLTVFDEIDAGIGGLVADQVGKRLAALSRERQVVVVTHLPVIAGRADAHLALRKRSRGGRTAVTAEALAGEDRERELARMMAGEGASEDARRTARTLLRGDG